MKLFGWRRKPRFFTEEEARLITHAIQNAEKRTSGEVRVYVESHCPWLDAIDRAKELFGKLKMQHTKERNASIVYVAVKDRQLAVYGDEGIHQKVGEEYWNQVVTDMLTHFNKNDYARGIAESVLKIGEALATHFPYDKDTDTNELSDEIVYGR